MGKWLRSIPDAAGPGVWTGMVGVLYPRCCRSRRVNWKHGCVTLDTYEKKSQGIIKRDQFQTLHEIGPTTLNWKCVPWKWEVVFKYWLDKAEATRKVHLGIIDTVLKSPNLENFWAERRSMQPSKPELLNATPFNSSSSGLSWKLRSDCIMRNTEVRLWVTQLPFFQSILSHFLLFFLRQDLTR